MSVPPEPNFLLIVNPKAGGGRAGRILPEVERRLDDLRQVFRVEKTRSLEHGIDLALEAIDAREIPVVISGDGLIGAIGGALAGSDVPIGIIPGGRGNDLARGLGIPADPVEAVDCLVKGHTRQIDVGEANEQRFLGIASAGFDSEANRIANEARIMKGGLVYAFAAFRALAGWKAARFTLVEGERRSRFTGYTVAVANNRFYGGGMMVAPEAELDDGEFDLITIGDVSRLRFLLNLPKVFRGTHVKLEESVEQRRVSGIEVSASRPMVVYADGDPLTELPARFRILRGALGVIVPGDEG